MNLRSMSRLVAAAVALLGVVGCVSTPAPEIAQMGPVGSAFPSTGQQETAGGPTAAATTTGRQRMPVDLPTVMRLASGRSYDVRIIRERVREAHAEMVHAGQWLVPSARVGVRYNDINGNVQATEGSVVDVNKENVFLGARIRLDWEIGEGIYNTLVANQRASARRADLCAGVNDAVLRAAEAYLDLLRAQTAAEVASQSVALYETFHAETEASAKAGGGFEGDVLNARSRLAHARVVRQRALGQAAVAAVRLRQLLDLPATITIFAQEPQPVPLDLIDPESDQTALIQEAMRGRPEIRSAAFQSGAARADHNRTSQGALYPDVRVDYRGGAFGDGFNDLGARNDVGVGVEWTVGRGGIGDTSRIAAAASRSRRARLRVHQVRQQVVRDVTAAQAQAQAAAAAIAAGRQGATDAERALGLYRERQKLGVGLPLEAVLAEETLTRSRIDLVDATVDYNKAQLRMLRAVGRRP